MLSSRPLFVVALVGLLAASCSSAVVTLPYGPAMAPPRVENPPSAPALQPVADDIAVPNGDFAPHHLADDPALAYDVAPRRLPPAEATVDPDEITNDAAPHRLALLAPAQPAAPPPANTARLGPLPFISQTVNNCGPASVAEVLSFWGVNRDQGDVQSVLRGDGNPYGMTPAGVPSYVASLGLDAVLGTAGSDELMKDLLRAGFPVIVNQTVSDDDREFHYRPLEGFDDEQGVFIASDPLMGPRHAIPYDEFDRVWAFTGQRFMVIYPPDKSDAVNAALAAGKWDPAYSEGSGSALGWSIPNSGPPPATTPVLSPKPAAGDWYAGPVKVSFKATDQSGFGVANTSYAVDNQPVQLYRGEFTIKEPGAHTVTFHSVNFSGSREPDQKLAVDIDQTPPVTTLTVDGAKDASGAYRAPARLTVSATDDGSGVAKTTCSLDGGPAQPYSAPVSLPAGAHAVSCGSADQAGNEEAPKPLNVTVQPEVANLAVAPPSSAPPSTCPSAPASAPSAGCATSAPGAPSGSGCQAQASPSAASAPAPSPACAGSSRAGGPAPPAAPSAPAGGYAICLQYDPNKANKVGQPIALRLQLCDAAGKNLSSPSVALTLQYILGPPNGQKPALPSPFRFDPSFSGYAAEEPAGLALGSYMLYFTAAGDSALHSVQFRIG